MTMLTQKSQVTVPKKIRVLLGIGPGDEVDFIIRNDKVILCKKEKVDIIRKYTGFLGEGKTEDIIEELR